MKRKILYCAWAFFYVLCAALGHIADAEGAQSAAMTVLSLVCFVPGFWLLADGIKRRNRKGVLCLRLISGLSLGMLSTALPIIIIAIANPDVLLSSF